MLTSHGQVLDKDGEASDKCSLAMHSMHAGTACMQPAAAQSPRGTHLGGSSSYSATPSVIFCRCISMHTWLLETYTRPYSLHYTVVWLQVRLTQCLLQSWQVQFSSQNLASSPRTKSDANGFRAWHLPAERQAGKLTLKMMICSWLQHFSILLQHLLKQISRATPVWWDR